MSRRRRSWLLVAAVALVPGVAHADAGVPMLFVVMPALGLSLVPIILIEAACLRRQLHVPWRQAGDVSLVANLVSTVAGVPLTWLALVLVQLLTGGGGAYGLNSTLGRIAAVTWQAAWLIPYEKDLPWMVPVAGTVLMVPFFFVSWWMEFRVLRLMAPAVPADQAHRAVRNANLITYALLLLWPLVFFVRNPS